MIFTCRHKVIKRTSGPKISQNVFSSPNRPENVLNGIPQISGTPWKKDHLGLEKSMVTKYGVWETWDDFSFLKTKKTFARRLGTPRDVSLTKTCTRRLAIHTRDVAGRLSEHCMKFSVKKSLKFFYSQISHKDLYKAWFSRVVTKWSKQHVVLNCHKTFLAHQIGPKKF